MINFKSNFFELSEKRLDKLADYMLNLSVASFAVGAFGKQWLGLMAAIIFLIMFFYITGKK